MEIELKSKISSSTNSGDDHKKGSRNKNNKDKKNEKYIEKEEDIEIANQHISPRSHKSNRKVDVNGSRHQLYSQIKDNSSWISDLKFSNIDKSSFMSNSDQPLSKKEIQKMKKIINFGKWIILIYYNMVFTLFIILYYSFLLVLKTYNINKYPQIVIFVIQYGISIANFVLLVKTVIEFKYVKKKKLNKISMRMVPHVGKIGANSYEKCVLINWFELSLNDYINYRAVSVVIEIWLYITLICLENKPGIPDYFLIFFLTLEYVAYYIFRNCFILTWRLLYHENMNKNNVIGSKKSIIARKSTKRKLKRS